MIYFDQLTIQYVEIHTYSIWNFDAFVLSAALSNYNM